MVSLDILSQIDHLFDDVSDNDVQSSDHGDEGQQNEPSSPAEGDETVSDKQYGERIKSPALAGRERGGRRKDQRNRADSGSWRRKKGTEMRT